MTTHNNPAGISWMLASCVGATFMTLSIRELSPTLHPALLAFLRSLLGLWVVLPWAMTGELWQMRFSRPSLHIARGVLMGGSLNMGFYAVAHMPMTDVTILFFLAPIFVTALSGLLMGEQIGWRRWTAIMVAFVGTLVISRPGTGTLSLAALSAVGSSAAFAVSLLISKHLSPLDGSNSIYLSSGVVSTGVTLPLALVHWQWPAGGHELSWLTILVLASTLRQIADIRAYAMGEAVVVATVSYLRLVLIGAIGWAFYAEQPDAATWVGAALIVGSALYITLREAQLNRARRLSPGP